MTAAWSTGARATAATLLAIATLLFSATPAQAHTKGGPAATDYLTTLQKIDPHVPRLSARVVQNGTHLELNNRTGKTVEVLGYSGEPYLRITPEATYVNTLSPSAYRNEDLDPAQASDNHVTANATAPPIWRKLADSSRISWHDHRTHWMGDPAPLAAQRAPQSFHRIATWSVPLRLDPQGLSGAGTGSSAMSAPDAQRPNVQLRGTLDYVPPPKTGLWWAGMMVLLAAIVAASFATVRMGGSRRHITACLGGLLLLAAAAELLDSIGRALDLGATGLGLVGQILTTQTYGALTALVALGAAGLALRNHPGAPFALALSSACLVALGALTDVAVFSHSHAAVPWSGSLARLCTAATLALGAAVTISAWRLIATAHSRVRRSA